MCEALKAIAISLNSNITLPNFNSLASSFAYIVAGIVGWRGLSAWKAQLKGHQDYNLAKALILNIYKYQEAMNQLRYPALLTAEFPGFSNEELDIMSLEKKKFKEILYVYQKRGNRISKIRPKILEQMLEGQVLWGSEIRLLVEDLFKLEKNVGPALDNYLRAIDPDSTNRGRNIADDKWIYDALDDENDAYRKLFKEKLKAVEEYLKPKLKL